MKRKIEVEVEPLSQARWAKIDEALFDALDRGPAKPQEVPAATSSSRRRLVLGAFAFAAAAAAFRVFWRSGGDDDLTNASRIETGDAPSRLAVGTSTIEVHARSAVVASGNDEHGILVVLERGSVDCEVAPRRGRPAFVVQAGDVRVRVVGTRFSVRRAGEREVRVSVDHGAVEVTRAGSTTLLRDGESWPPEAALAPPPAAPAPQPSPEPAPSATPPPSAAPKVPHRPAASDQDLYEQAARSEARDPDGAMVTYRRLASGKGAWAAPSLFAAGRLAADRGRHAEARRLLEQYLKRYPAGPNAADARRLLSTLP